MDQGCHWLPDKGFTDLEGQGHQIHELSDRGGIRAV